MIRRLGKTLREKLSRANGFSLSEMLMVVLVLSLLMMVIGGGVSVVQNAYVKIPLKADAQVLLSTAIASVSDEFRFASKIQTAKDSNGNDVPTFVSGSRGYRVWFENGSGADGSGQRGILMKYKVGSNTRTSQLLTDQTMNDGLMPDMTYSYNSSTGLFEATITVKKNSTVMASQTIQVRALNS